MSINFPIAITGYASAIGEFDGDNSDGKLEHICRKAFHFLTYLQIVSEYPTIFS